MECWFYDIMRIQPAYITIMTIKLNTEHYDYNVDIIYMMTKSIVLRKCIDINKKVPPSWSS